MTVHIICAVLDGAPFLGEFLESLQRQTHADWRLWIRDDGSSDDSVRIVRAVAEQDPRVALLHTGGPKAGVARAFAWLLERVPGDASYVMCADQDDVWLPQKIERTLSAMQAAEAASPGVAILVHTDLVVVDAGLRELHPSLWTLAGMQPEPVTLRRFVVRNVVTGATVMINRTLIDLIGSAPAEAIYHDWWYALAAAAFGRVVAVPRPTILYRQHGRNAVGAYDARVQLRMLPTAIRSAVARRAQFRNGIRQTGAQALAFLGRYGARLDESDRRFLRDYAELPNLPFLSRKRALLRLRALPERGMLHTLGVLLRG